MAPEFHRRGSARGSTPLVGLEDADHRGRLAGDAGVAAADGEVLEQYVEVRLGPEHCDPLADLIVAEALPLPGRIGALVGVLGTAAAERRTLVTVPDRPAPVDGAVPGGAARGSGPTMTGAP